MQRGKQNYNTHTNIRSLAHCVHMKTDQFGLSTHIHCETVPFIYIVTLVILSFLDSMTHNNNSTRQQQQQKT